MARDVVADEGAERHDLKPAAADVVKRTLDERRSEPLSLELPVDLGVVEDDLPSFSPDSMRPASAPSTVSTYLSPSSLRVMRTSAIGVTVPGKPGATLRPSPRSSVDRAVVS